MRQITVYADMLFLVNWLMDYVLLMAVAAILRLKIRRWRILAASAVGAAWVCLIVVVQLPEMAEELGSLLLVSSLMLLIAFKPTGLKALSRELIALYAVAFLGGGAVNLLYFHTVAGQYLKELVWGRATAWQGSTPVIFVNTAAVIVVVKWSKSLMIYRHRRSCIYTAKLYLGEYSVTLAALLDTGNSLREPITRKAVHIAEKKSVQPLQPDREEAVKLLVPYHAVGTKAGLLTALRIDRMELTAENGRQMVIEQPLIGLYDEKLSTKEEYQLILHTEIETKQGETL